MKKITIITASFNSEKFIEESINSVISQIGNDDEYIIIDGGSKDGTVDIIKKYEKSITYWKSEKDEGIYDAWNKGLKQRRPSVDPMKFLLEGVNLYN